ncbi:MAG: AbrB/MazE/SpoVT family DNA-binding domain-containing protein [Patescibacteria group bacterium]
MNLGTVTRPNSKGQIVIPKKFRDELGIDKDVLLNITFQGNGFYVTPLEKSLVTSDSRKILLEVLKMTAGAWKGDDWPETEKKRRKVELAVAKKRRSAW